MTRLVLCILFLLLLPGALLAAARSATPIQFNRDIRPLLSDRCFKCHGPDKASRKANLRLDLPEEAFAERKKSKGFPLVPRKPDQSLVFQRIISADPEEQMPPPESHLSLTTEEKERIRRWIAEGAKFDPHWAFIPLPKIVPVPKVKNRQWPRTELDRFILARLESARIKPSRESTRERWLRRVSYDLNGLPPAPGEVKAFLNDRSAAAYETVVDRLLASKRFGERMAVPWLDAARYADSYGYQSDQLSPTWHFRDWVVEAFNRNLPYDRFLTEQLAGDLVPGAGRSERLATAFNRLHRQTNEGGSIEEEWRNEYVSDRIHTFGTTFLALTLECSRCHDHKFDPISQRDYYAFSAFFNSIDEAGLYNDSARVPSPSLLLPTPAQEKVMDETSRLLKEKNAALLEVLTEVSSTFSREKSSALSEITGRVAHFSMDQLAGTNQQQFSDSIQTNLSSAFKANVLGEGKFGKAVKFTGDDEITFTNALGSLQPWRSYTVVFWLQLPATLTNAVIFHRTEGTDVGFHGTELSMELGRLFFVIKRFWPGNAIAIRSEKVVPTDRWIQLAVSYDGSARAEGLSLSLDGQPLAAEVVRNNLFKSPQNGGGGISFGARFRSTGLKEALLDELQIFNRVLSSAEKRFLFEGKSIEQELSALPEAELRETFLAGSTNERLLQARQDRSDAVKNFLESRNGVAETMVMEEMASARPAYLLARGNYDAPRNDQTRVARSTPRFLPEFPKGVASDRAGLANWLTAADHPLTARVAVNRWWQMLFGEGLVSTTDNFGLQGAPPSHPELLDWMARDLIASGWNIKAVLKKMVLSATYRQDSVIRKEVEEKDPENRLLARGPSQRLPAEMIRDTALAASGLLDEEMGGPPVSPYQPGDLWRESNSMSPAYKQSVGTALYRRSLYTVWKRTAPMPNLTAFDAPTREFCVVKRTLTGSPQQAFVLLNDPQFVESARVLAESLLKNERSLEQRVESAFLHLAGRQPTPEEGKLLRELWLEQKNIFAAEPERAEKLIAVGEKKRDSSLDPVELAATTALAQAILNLDATIWKR